MRKLNLRWLVGLVIVPIVLAGFAYLLHEFQMKRNASVFVREAKRAQQEDRPEDAAVHLRRYVKLDPNETEGLILYGFQLADLNRVQAAYLTLEDAIRRAPDRLDVRRRLVDLSIKLGRISEAMEHLEKYLLKESPQDSELLELMAACELGKKDFKAAEASLMSAIKYSPDRVDSYVKLARLRQEKQDLPKEANDSIDEMVANNSTSPRAFINRALWRERQFSQSQAAKKVGVATPQPDLEALRSEIQADIQEALKLAPDDIDALLLSIRIAEMSGNNDEARTFIQRGIDVSPTDSRFYVALADLEASSGNLKAAADSLKRGVLVAPKNADLKWNLANRLIDLGDDAAAQDVILQLRSSKHPESLIGYLEARILVQRSEWSAAIKKLEEIRPTLRDRPLLAKQVDYWLGIAFRETNSPDQQLASVRRALAWDPDWNQAKLALAEALASSNLFQEAVSEYRQICAKPGAPISATLGLEKSLLQLNKSKSPGQRNWVEFDEVLKKIEQLESQKVPVAILKMERQLAEDNREEAEKTITAEREKKPDDIQLWIIQIEFAQAGREWDRVDQLIEQAEGQFGDSVTLRRLKGRSIVLRHSAEAARDLLRPLAVPPADWSEPQRLQLASDFALQFLTIGDLDEAEKLALMVDAALPNNLAIRLLLLDIAKRAKKPELMERTLEEIRISAGEGAIWHYGQAHRSILLGDETKDKQNYLAAIAHLEKALVTRPTWERIHTLWGETFDRMGEFGAATEHYVDAIKLGEKSPIVTNRAVNLLLNAKRFDEADKLLRLLKENQSVFTEEMVRAEIELSLILDRKDQALKLVEQLASNSQRKVDPMWLGQTYFRLEKFDKAAEQFQAAVDANKTVPGPWLALVSTYVKLKQPEKAQAAIDEAKNSIARELALLSIGQAYEILGRNDLARDSYRTAMEQSPDNMDARRRWVGFLLKPETAADAELALRKMLKESTGSSEVETNERQWARQGLIRALGLQGGREKLTEALKMLDDDSGQNEAKSLNYLRMKANILGMFPSRAEQQQSIELLEKLVVQEPSEAIQMEDRRRLAGLYQKIGEAAKSRTELRKMIAARRDDPRTLRDYIQLCLQAKEFAEAELYLTPLKKLSPDELSTHELEVQVLYARKKYDDIASLAKLIGMSDRRKNETPVSLALRRLWSAKLFEALAIRLARDGQKEVSDRFNAEAETLFTKLAEEKPDEILTLAEFLAGTDQLDRSFELLEKHDGELTSTRLTRITQALMKNPSATAEQLGRLQDLLKSHESSQSNPIPLMLISADLLSWRGEVEAATDLYQEVLRLDEKNVVALNNLAVLIALTGGDHSRAMRLITAAIEIGGPMDALLDTRGLVHLAAGHSDLAVKDFEKAISSNENAERCFHAAVAFARMMRVKEAESYLERAIEIGLVEHELHPLERLMLAKLRAQLNLPAISK